MRRPPEHPRTAPDHRNSPATGSTPASSRSAEISRSRPFYADHADVYDLLVTDPVEPWVSAVHSRLLERKALSASVLDAGCGTGRHAAALRSLGHELTLVDASPALLRIASSICPGSPALLADLCALDIPDRVDAVTCRGVLNDLLTDEERQSAVNAMARCLTAGGILFCDVREAAASRLRADGRERERVTALPSGGSITFTSTSTWSAGLIRVHEEHLATGEHAVTGATKSRSTYDFVMRPWTHRELLLRLDRAGLRQVRIAPGVGRRTRDRLFVTATCP